MSHSKQVFYLFKNENHLQIWIKNLKNMNQQLQDQAYHAFEDSLSNSFLQYQILNIIRIRLQIIA